MEDGNVAVEQFFKESKFYENAEIYWSSIEPTVNGMLGGFGNISSIDIQGSELFLKKLFSLKNKPGCKRALDCGAGIGRITKNLLVKHFEKVDLVEQNAKFIEASKKFLSCEKNIGNFYNSGLQNFVPVNNCYDIIWCQWVLGHLTDNHLVSFLNHCSMGLKKNGVIVIKENISCTEVVIHEEDSSITRTEKMYLEIFKKSGLEIVRHCKQQHFPKQLFNVKLFALRPGNADASAHTIQNYDDVKTAVHCQGIVPGSAHLVNKLNIVSICDET